MRAITAIFFLLISYGGVYAQDACTALGQTPGTAFPVCGSSVFKQESVPICTNAQVRVPGCSGDGAAYADKNPYWYKFTCFKSGTLSFLIEPNDQGDDYDWQLYDITGHSPSEVYTDTKLIVAANWAGTYGNTGAEADGVNYTQCASDPVDKRPSFAKSPRLVAGHHYLLLVSHFTDSQSGYSLSFSGGTAVITDTTAPRLQKAFPACDGFSVAVRLNKSVQCKSLAADGSDFTVSPGTAGVIAASGADCSNSFDMDSLVLTFDRRLTPGNYTVTIRNGTDHNTLLDNCNNGIPEGDTLHFTIQKVPATPMDTIPPVGCAPGTIRVVFGGAVRCNSIAPDGSDFMVTGPAPVMITGAEGVHCENNLSDTVEITLGAPIVKGGRYVLSLKTGSDGNTILNECAEETPVGSSLAFSTKDTVSASFTRRIKYNCNTLAVDLHNDGRNGINRWNWTTGSGLTDTTADFSYTDTSFDEQQIRLFVSNGVCSDSAAESFMPDQDYFAEASFEEPSFVCPDDEVTFVDHSRGNITSYRWDFGNGKTSLLETPAKQQYPVVVRTRDFPVMLVVENTLGCRDTAVRNLKVINNCFIAVPTAFTPNGDGMNDYLYPLNAYKASDLEFRVYNRYGQMVFETKDWTRKWDGAFHGTPQPTGSYVWMLSYINTDTGEKVFKKGATLLIR